MTPAAIIGEHPEGVPVEHGQVGHHRGGDVFDPLFEKGAGEMVVVDHIGSALGPQQHRDQVLAEVGGAAFLFLLAPQLPLLVDLAQAHRHLGGPELGDGDGSDAGFAAAHGRLLRCGQPQGARQGAAIKGGRAPCGRRRRGS